MIFYFNSNGEPIGSIIDRVFCGSVNASDVYFVAPISSDALVSVAYLLANGETTQKIPMQSVNDESNVNLELEDNVIYNAWKTAIPPLVTTTSGEVVIQFYVSNNDGSIISTARSIFSVEEGLIPKELDSDASYDEIATIISGLNAIVKKVNSALSSAFVSDSSTIINENQLVVGRYNKENTSASFIAGCGTSETDRKNGFCITNDGYAKTTKVPLADDDVVNKAYVDAKSTNVGVNVEISEQVDNVILTDVKNKQIYYKNNVNALTLNPNNGTQIGDGFYILFNSGSVPTEFIKPQIGNMIIEEIIPRANHVVEISGVWNGAKWIVLSQQTAV